MTDSAAKPRIAWQRRLARHLRRWGAFWVVALGLLALSQAVWWWQTWPVRALLESLAQVRP